MGDTVFHITPEEVKNLGEKMKSSAGEMIEKLKEISTTMNTVPDDYQGAASEEITQKYNSLSSHFKDFQEQVNTCADMLIANANSIAEAEEAARRAASANL